MSGRRPGRAAPRGPRDPGGRSVRSRVCGAAATVTLYYGSTVQRLVISDHEKLAESQRHFCRT
eukprot:380983-Hanusia_phi.AAC.1